MNRYGPAGIPLSSKGRTIKDGIEDVHMMGLSAIEIQMIRNFVEQRPPEDFEVGMRPEEVRSSFIVEVGKPDGDEYIYTSTGKEVIEEDDILTVLHVPSVGVNYMELRAMGRLARMLDVKVAVHSQYYIDLISGDEITYRSLDNIMWSGVVAREVGAEMVITHMGPYGDVKKKEAMNRVKENLTAILERFRENGITAKIAVETSGKQELFGSVNEVLALAKSIDGVIPLLNYAHIHSREDGSLKTPDDFKKLFQKVRKYLGSEIYGHFSGVEYDGGNETRATPIKKGDLKFEPLAEGILDSDEDFVLICDSPLLEHDAMYMKVITERTLSKRIAKEKREMERLEMERERIKKEQEEEAERKKKETEAESKKAASKKQGEKKTDKKGTGKTEDKPAPAKKDKKGGEKKAPASAEAKKEKKAADKKEAPADNKKDTAPETPVVKEVKAKPKRPISSKGKDTKDAKEVRPKKSASKSKSAGKKASPTPEKKISKKKEK